MLEFENFCINPVRLNDAWSICNFVVSNEGRLRTYFPKTLEQNLTPDLSKRFVELKTKQFDLKEEFLFVLKEKKTKVVAGLTYIKELDWDKKKGEFAYCIGYQFENKGLTSKVVKLLSEYAFEKLNVEILQIIVNKHNIASVNVAKNNNFSWKKTLKNSYIPPNSEPLNMELYELHKL